jgi:hypothetical protein
LVGTSYNGLGANIAAPASVAVSDASNTTPIEITTSTAHGMLSGDYVDIAGVEGNTAANGVWQVAVLDATHFNLTGSVGNGAFVAAGTPTAQCVTFSGNVGLNPANGDALNASTWIPGMSCPQDRTSFLAKNLGAYKLVGVTPISATLDSNTQWSLTGPSATGTWTVITSSPLVGFAYVNGDLLDITFTTTVQAQNGIGVTQQNIGLVYASQVPGGALSPYQEVNGSGVMLSNVATGGGPLTPVALAGVVSTTFGGVSALFVQVGIGVYQLGNTAGGVAFYGSRQLTIRQYRPTGWPQ